MTIILERKGRKGLLFIPILRENPSNENGDTASYHKSGILRINQICW